MPVFSSTAPIFTEKEERLEQQNLSEGERDRIYSDVYGGAHLQDDGKEQESTETIDTVVTSELINERLDRLEQELNSMPSHEKKDYVAAMEGVPDLVARESPRIAFLRAYRFDACAAAVGLKNYWKYRVKFFGTERAFLPMTLDGAMANEINHLEKALVFCLPDDASGRAVVYLNRVRWTPQLGPRESLVRCYWYALQCLVERELIQSRGYVLVLNHKGFDFKKQFDRVLVKHLHLCTEAFPLPLKASHAVTGPGSSVVSAVTMPMVKHMIGRHHRLRTILHAGSPLEIRDDLARYGMGDVHADYVNGNAARDDSVEMRRFLNSRRELESALTTTT